MECYSDRTIIADLMDAGDRGYLAEVSILDNLSLL